MTDRDKYLAAWAQEQFGVSNAAEILRTGGPPGLRAEMEKNGIQAKSHEEPNDLTKESREKAAAQSAQLMLALVEAQNDQEDRIAKMATEVQGYKATNETLLATVKELRDLVAAGPQKPSQSSATILSNEERKAVESLEVNKEVEKLSAQWGVPMKAGG